MGSPEAENSTPKTKNSQLILFLIKAGEHRQAPHKPTLTLPKGGNYSPPPEEWQNFQKKILTGWFKRSVIAKRRDKHWVKLPKLSHWVKHSSALRAAPFLAMTTNNN